MIRNGFYYLKSQLVKKGGFVLCIILILIVIVHKCSSFRIYLSISCDLTLICKTLSVQQQNQIMDE